MSAHVYCDGDRSQGDDRRLYLRADWSDGALDFVERRAGGGVPAREWHGHLEAFALPVQGVTVRDWGLLQEALQPLVARVMAGYESEWSGSDRVARFSADADAAREEMRETLERWSYDEVQVWQAGDWLAPALLWRDEMGRQCGHVAAVSVACDDWVVTPETTDEQLAEIAQRLEGEVDADMVVLGIGDCLTEMRDELRDNAAE